MDNNASFFELRVERDTLLHQLNESRKAEELTDVKLQMSGKLFPAHRAVLFHSSPVLKALISERWSTTNVYSLSDQYVDVEIVEDLLNFLYTGSIKLTPDNVHPVCVAAHFLQIQTLLEPSLKYLCQFITIENVFTFFKFSTACELEELNYHCCKFINNNHENFLKSLHILEFSFKDFKDLIVGLKKFWNEMLRENTFQCIVRWTETDLAGRLEKLSVLLKNIPLEELPPKFLVRTVSTHRLVKASISGIETVSAALSNYRTYSTDSNPPWKNNQNMIVLGGVTYLDDSCLDVRLYDSRSGLWRELPNMPSGRFNFAVTVVNHQDIIICGGEMYRKPFSSVIMFDWSTQTWTGLPDMPVVCGTPSAVICNDHLYVVGKFCLKDEEMTHSRRVLRCPAVALFPGAVPNDDYFVEEAFMPEEEKAEYAKKVLRYSFKTKQWEFVASLASPCGKLIEHKNCLYAIGGRSKAIQKYDPEQDKWTTMTTSMNSEVDAVTVHQNKIYIVQRYGASSVYNPETDSFEPFPELPHELERTSVVSLNGKLLAVGGYGYYNDEHDPIDLIFEFDFSTGKWIEFGRMIERLSSPCTAVGAFY